MLGEFKKAIQKLETGDWLFIGLYFFIAIILTCILGNSVRGLAYLLGLPLAFFGLYLANKRTTVLEAQSKNDLNRLKTDSDRLVTETFAKSMEHLGHDQAAVRQGGIYALGKIAKNNLNDHPVIINSLCAFIRDWSQKLQNKNLNANNMSQLQNSGRKKEKSREADCCPRLLQLAHICTHSRLPIDIETAIEVIKNRNRDYDQDCPDGVFLYDLSNIIIKDANFSNANLSYFNLRDSYFDNCAFNATDFTGASLIGTTFINGSDFQDAILNNADLQGIDLSNAINLTQEQINNALTDDKTKYIT